MRKAELVPEGQVSWESSAVVAKGVTEKDSFLVQERKGKPKRWHWAGPEAPVPLKCSRACRASGGEERSTEQRGKGRHEREGWEDPRCQSELSLADNGGD